MNAILDGRQKEKRTGVIRSLSILSHFFFLFSLSLSALTVRPQIKICPAALTTILTNQFLVFSLLLLSYASVHVEPLLRLNDHSLPLSLSHPHSLVFYRFHAQKKKKHRHLSTERENEKQNERSGEKTSLNEIHHRGNDKHRICFLHFHLQVRCQPISRPTNLSLKPRRCSSMAYSCFSLAWHRLASRSAIGTSPCKRTLGRTRSRWSISFRRHSP